MSDMEGKPEQDGMPDRMNDWLRGAMPAAVPELPRDFDRRVMGELKRRSRLDGPRQTLLAGYGVVSVMVSAAIMRGQGIGWGMIAGMILGPLAVVAMGRVAWGERHKG